MGKIVEKAKKLWLHGHHEIELAEAIDTEVEALRQEIQDLKTDIRNGSIFAKEPAPEPELQRGDVVSYISDGDVPGRMKGDKVLGIFHHQNNYQNVWAHFQEPNGDFNKTLGIMPRHRITFELRPEK